MILTEEMSPEVTTENENARAVLVRAVENLEDLLNSADNCKNAGKLQVLDFLLAARRVYMTYCRELLLQPANIWQKELYPAQVDRVLNKVRELIDMSVKGREHLEGPTRYVQQELAKYIDAIARLNSYAAEGLDLRPVCHLNIPMVSSSDASVRERHWRPENAMA